jgi:hypothetical protein
MPQRVAFDASGNLYFDDSNNNRIREVHFAGFPTLTLTNVSINNAGSYTVVITSPYGSATSSVAVINVAASAPQIMATDGVLGFAANQFGFNVSGPVGQTVVVDGSSNLVNWIPLFTNPAAGTPFYFFDPASTNLGWRFYRARVP